MIKKKRTKMKPLDAHSWSQQKQNKDRFPNGTVVSEVMEAYAKYYYNERRKIDILRKQWQSEWHNKHRLLDIDFEAYYKMMNHPDL
jgi:hypothetical protein